MKTKTFLVALLITILASCSSTKTLSPVVTQSLPSPTPTWKTYTDNTLFVALEYPPDWKIDNSGNAVYSGADGFFQITAVALFGPSADAACELEIQNNMGKEGNRYGAKPTQETLQVDGQHACLILPSDDQPESNRGLSLLIVEYPKSVRDGALLQFWADKNHMQNFIKTLKFIR